MQISIQDINWPVFIVVQTMYLVIIVWYLRTKDIEKKNFRYLIFCLSTAIACPIILWAFNIPAFFIQVGLVMFPAIMTINYFLTTFCTSCGVQVKSIKINKGGFKCESCSQ